MGEGNKEKRGHKKKKKIKEEPCPDHDDIVPWTDECTLLNSVFLGLKERKIITKK